MFSTNHNSERRAAPSAYSRGEAAFIPPTSTLPTRQAAQNPNRHSLARLEFAVIPTKQRPEMVSNRHLRGARTVSSPLPPPHQIHSRSSVHPHFYSVHTNSRIPPNSFKTNHSDHFYYGQMNTFRNCSAPCVDRLSCVTYNEICAATQPSPLAAQASILNFSRTDLASVAY